MLSALLISSLFLLSSIVINEFYFNFKIIKSEEKSPHIVFILADDLGWNDVGYNNPDIQTPVIDRLSAEGIRLNNSYMQNLCTPSRAAIMTGYYPFRTGLQHGVVFKHSTMALPLKFKLFPEKLIEAGYSTHLIGKWHLGHCNSSYLPTSRGFQTAYGCYSGSSRYFTRQLVGEDIYDFFNTSVPLIDNSGIHSSDLNMKQLEHVLSSYTSSSQPLFLFFPFNLPHTPLEAKEKHLKLYSNLSANPIRQTYSAMVSALDDDIGTIVQKLKSHNLYENSIIIFSSDNGGHTTEGGSNFPLRGAKVTLYEGGHRVVGFLHSPLLNYTGFVYNGLIHAVDWFSTILGIANIKASGDVDGINLWKEMTNNLPSLRKEMVYNLNNYNESTVNAAIRVGDWKLISGSAGVPSGIYTPENVSFEYRSYSSMSDFAGDPLAPPIQLYNLKTDPSEYVNVADAMPEKVHELQSRLDTFLREAVPPLWTPNDEEIRKRALETKLISTTSCEI